MTRLSNEDWDHVNAYHDNALSPDEAQAYEKRLTDEPALAAALADVASISRSLRALRPAIKETSTKRIVEGRTAFAGTAARYWWIGGSLVASLLLFLVIGTAQIGPRTLLDVHKAFVEQQFDVDRSFNHNVGSLASPNQPDLTGGNLTSVALREFQNWSVAHYAGRNGCRLSYFRGRGELVLPTERETQISAWSTMDGVQHAIIATGMDTYRFDATAAYLRQTTKQIAINHAYASMVDATQRATPCVG